MKVIIFELMCIAMFYAAFCRAVNTTRATRQGLRLVIMLAGMVSAIGMAAPMVWAYQPDWYAMVLLAFIIISKGTVARYWTHARGVPPEIDHTRPFDEDHFQG